VVLYGAMIKYYCWYRLCNSMDYAGI
jgi:hypothetical protein